MGADDYCERRLRSIMFAHGDAREPLRETLLLLKSAVEHQLVRYFQAAMRLSSTTAGKRDRCTSCIDLLTAMRFDGQLLRQTIYKFAIRDSAMSAKRLTAESNADVGPHGRGQKESERLRLCDTAISLLFPAGSTLQKLLISQRKAMKAYQLKVYKRCASLDEAEYKELSLARTVSFLGNAASFKRFRLWLKDMGFDKSAYGASPLVIELMATAAYVITASIMDIASSLPFPRDSKHPLQPEDMKEAVRLYMTRLIPVAVL